ncbi:hypothetical protein TNCV_4574161 [Trichonephila clavipes]|nr:hypothetical protein TNCV_4574161 [Trichonephila clavipes]
MRLTEVTATLTSSSDNIQHSQIFLKNAHWCSRRSLFKRRKGFLRDHALTDLRLGLGFNHRSWSLSSHVLTLKLGQNHGQTKLQLSLDKPCSLNDRITKNHMELD